MTTAKHHRASADGSVLVVMNGIIENYMELRSELQNAGVVFASETDTEVVPQLIARAYDGDLAAAVRPSSRAWAATSPSWRPTSPSRAAGRGRREVPAGHRRGAGRALRRLGDPGLPERDARRRPHRGRRGSCPRPRWARDLAEPRPASPTRPEPGRVGRGRRREGRLRVVHAQEIHEQPAALWDTISDRLQGDGSVDLDGLGLDDAALARVDRSTSWPATPRTTPAWWAGT